MSKRFLVGHRGMLRQVQRPAKTSSQQDVTNLEPDLVPCYEDNNFEWASYMSVCGTMPACDENIFAHYAFLEQTVCERIFTPGSAIFVRTHQGRSKLAIVEVATVVQLMIQYVGEDKIVTISVDDVVLDGEAQEQENTLLDRKKDWNFVKFTEADKKIAHKKLREIINVGEYFEIQDDIEPRMVSVARILKNRGGVVTYEVGGTQHNVHISSERCHVMGWCESGVQKVAYHKDDSYLLSFAKARSVNKLVFERKVVTKHNVKVGQMVEVIDSFMPSVIYPGFVSALFNEHYFRVAVTPDKRVNNYEIVCDSSFPFIFPPGWCKANGLRLAIPEGFDDDFSWAEYQDKLKLEGPLPEDAVEYPKVTRTSEPMRHLEMICFRQNLASAALITKSHRHLLWISFDHETAASPSAIYDFNSTNLFPCGFAKKFGIKMLYPAKFNTLPPLKENETRFGRDKLFNTMPTPVFTPSRKPYLPHHWREFDHWLPRVYVNANCFCGPFIDPEKIAVLKTSYGPGPMELIIKNILRDLLDSVYWVNDLFRLFEWADNTILPTMFGKKDRRKDRKTDLCKILRVPRCESARTFAGWMRMFLRVLEACPMLFSMEKVRMVCPIRCDLVKKNPFIKQWNLMSTDSKSIPKHHPITASGPCPPLITQMNLPITRAQTTDKREPSRKDVHKRRHTNKPDSKTGLPKKKRASKDLPASMETAEGALIGTASASSTDIDANGVARIITVSEDDDSMPALVITPNTTPLKVVNDRVTPDNFTVNGPTTFPHTSMNLTSSSQVMVSNVSINQTQPQDVAVSSSPIKHWPSVATPTPSQTNTSIHPSVQSRFSTQSLTPITTRVLVQKDSLIQNRSPVKYRSPAQTQLRTRAQSHVPGVSQASQKAKELQKIDDEKSDKSIHLLSDPYTWLSTEVTAWLKSMGGDFDEIAIVLEREDIDGAKFLMLTLNECLVMGFKFGPALKLTQLITTLKEAHEQQFA